MKITILHNAVADSDSAADRDVLVQVAIVEHALRTLGHQTNRLVCTLNLETVEETLTTDRPQLVFNLVESLGGSDRLAHLAAVLLDDLDLPYTGTPAAAIHLTNNKPRTKERMRFATLPTPNWVVAESCEQKLEPPYIIKAVWEHASLGIDDHAVILSGDGATVCDQIASRSRQLGHGCFAEQFIDGREFNLSLLATTDGPRVLPPAEIDFRDFPASRPKIVGFAAKWDERAVEFAKTPRTFDFKESDAPLLDWLRALAIECWSLFGLAGYARVDFRVGGGGQPWILEINANPCLSPDAGFAAALAQADIPLQRAIEWIIEDALRPKGQESRVGWDQRAQLAPAHHDSHHSPTHHSPLTSSSAVPTPKKEKPAPPITLRTKPKRTDPQIVRQIVTATALFREAEIDVAVELVQTRLKRGASGYEFVFAEHDKEVVGYICFGRNTLTVGSCDVYWIAVEPGKQGRGIGQLLLEEAERQIAATGGTRIYIETSHRADYQATRGFYERCGYQLVAVLDDFYAPGDSKATYFKAVHALRE